MSSELQINPVGASNKYHWNTQEKRRIFQSREGYLRVQKLDGNTNELPYSDKSCELSITPRDLPIEVLGFNDTLRDNRPVPSKVLRDMENFVSKGEIGDFLPHHSLIVGPIDISRGIALTHPLLPGQVIYASGVGIFTHESDNRKKLILNNPDPTKTVRQFALEKGLDSMSTMIPTPDGEAGSSDNDAPLGAYRLGSPDELNHPANGKETLFRKVDQTNNLERLQKDIFVAPHVLMYGAYSTIPDAGWFFYSLPQTIEPLEIYKLGKILDKRTGQKQYLYELFSYQFIEALQKTHTGVVPTFHGQPHMGNWHIVLDLAKNPPIAITDLGTSVDLSAFPRERVNNQPSPFEMATGLDFSIAVKAIVSAHYTDMRKLTPLILGEISNLISYCFAGYFRGFSLEDITQYVGSNFSRVISLKALQYEIEGKNNLDPVEEIDSILNLFLPRIFFNMSKLSSEV